MSWRVDAIPAPLAASRDDFNVDPRLAALFESAEHMLDWLGRDRTMIGFLKEASVGTERLIALLLAERVEKNVLGMELAGEQVRRDVAQLTVSFRNYRLVDVADSEAETRRLLKRRAFDHLGLHLAEAALLHENADDLRAEARARWGRRVLVSLAYAVAGARTYPTMKRVLGHAHVCERLVVRGESVTAARAA